MKPTTPNQYTARALKILEFDATYNPPGLYLVTVGGKLLADECTYALRIKIENQLRDGWKEEAA
jgi:hypothetical protein